MMLDMRERTNLERHWTRSGYQTARWPQRGGRAGQRDARARARLTSRQVPPAAHAPPAPAEHPRSPIHQMSAGKCVSDPYDATMQERTSPSRDVLTLVLSTRETR